MDYFQLNSNKLIKIIFITAESHLFTKLTLLFLPKKIMNMKKLLLSLTVLLSVSYSLFSQCGYDNHTVTTSTNNIVCQGDVTVGLATSSPWDWYSLVRDGDTIQWISGDAASGPIAFDPEFINSTTQFEVVANNNVQPNSLYFSPAGLNYVQNPTNTINNIFTMQAWVNRSTHNPAQYYPIASFQGNTPSFGMINGELVLQIGGTTILQAFGSPVPELNWHHVAVTYNGNTGESVLYLDGAQIAANTTSTQTFSNNVLRIGGDFETLPNSFDGNIDNFAIFNTVLNSTQIWDYAQTCMDNTLPGLSALYKMNENTGTSTEDEVTATFGSFVGTNLSFTWSMGYWNVCSYPCSQSMGSPFNINIVPIPTENFTASTAFFCEPGNDTDISSSNSYDGATYYLVDASSNDIIGNGILSNGGGLTFNTGALNATTTFQVEASFISPSSGIYLANSIFMPDGNDISFSDFTLETWFKNDLGYTYTSDPDVILAFNYDQVNDVPLSAVSIRVDYQTGLPYINAHNFFSMLPQPTPSSGGTTNILDGEWHHLALAFDAVTGDYYLTINGVEEIVYNTPFIDNNWFGGIVVVDVAELESSGDIFPSARGTYDDIRFWDISRSESDIASAFADCLEGNEANLQGYWRVDEQTGNELMDAAGGMGSLGVDGIDGTDFFWVTGNTICVLCADVVSNQITVEVGDTEAPEVTCQNTTLNLDSNGEATLVLSDMNVIVTDNCDISPTVSLSQSLFTCTDVGSSISVIVTVEDASSNSATCSAQITILDDIDPTISNLPLDITVNANTAGCEAIVTWNLPDFNDNCGVASTTASHNPGDNFILGSTNVTYTVFDAAGNSTTASFNVNVVNDLAPDVIDITDVTCNGGNDGEIAITFTGGTFPFTYQWTNAGGFSSNDQNISNLVAGDYDGLVTDGNGCTASGTITVSEPDLLEISNAIITSPLLCGESTGAIDITVVGGVGAYLFDWSNGSNNEDLSTISAGTYTVEITDENGCIVTENYSLSDPDAPILTIDAGSSLLELACSYDENGEINMNIGLQGGATSATYDWNSGQYSTQNISDLSPGTYILTVVDNNDCTSSIAAEVTAPDEISVLETIQNLACNGEATGTITIDVIGGTGAYNFDWNNGGFTSQNLEDLNAGNYEVVITDGNGCESTSSYVITQPDAIVISEDVTDIVTGNDGAVAIIVTGGTGAHTYAWTGPNGFSSSNMNLSGLTDAGEYTVVVTDENGCQVELTVTVESFVNLQENFELGFNLYPNPSNGSFYISSPLAEGRLIVTDALGRVIKTKEINNYETKIDLLEQETGVYYFEITQGSNKTTLRGVLK